MLFSLCLFVLFSSFGILSSLFVIFSKNPIFSILFLIFTFANVSCLLFLFDLEFLPVVFLIVYVGAIAVLFLFVLMMLNIKLSELQESYSTLIPIVVIFILFFSAEFLFLSCTEFLFINDLNSDSSAYLSDILNSSISSISFSSFFGVYSNVKTVALALFQNYLLAFLITGYVLLLAMLAAIVLTIQKTFVSKAQNIYSQIMADYTKSVVNYQ